MRLEKRKKNTMHTRTKLIH